MCSVDNILHVSWSGQYYVHKSKCVNQSFSWELFYIPSCKMLARSKPRAFLVVSNNWSLARLSRLHKNWNEEPLVVEALHRVIRLFGVQRCMFASNAPVDQQDGWPPSRVFRVTSLNFSDFFACLWDVSWHHFRIPSKWRTKYLVDRVFFGMKLAKHTIELMRYERIKTTLLGITVSLAHFLSWVWYWFPILFDPIFNAGDIISKTRDASNQLL